MISTHTSLQTDIWLLRKLNGTAINASTKVHCKTIPGTGAAFTIIEERYVALLEHVFQDEQNSDIWFKQDGAPAHTSLMAVEWLKSRFQNQIMSG